jgi:glycosyltransferase involved in cell wall biosynthesis
VAGRISRRYGIPWIADFPDLWADNHNYPLSRWRQRLDARLERRTLRSAAALVTVSADWAARLARRHGRARTRCIEHGFPEQELNPQVLVSGGPFRIVYTGTIYPEMQKLDLFFGEVRELLDSGRIAAADLRIDFYGTDPVEIEERCRRHGVTGVVHLHPRISKAEVSAVQRQAHLLLLFASHGGEQRRGWYTSKLYDYIGSRRPILVCGGMAGDVLEVLMPEYRFGVSCREPGEVRAALSGFIEEFAQTGAVRCHSRLTDVRRFSYRTMTRRFVHLLDLICGSQSQPGRAGGRE